MQFEGHLDKMPVELARPVAYRMALDDELVPLNNLIGSPLQIEFLNTIHCTHCGRLTKKSFNQGYCYPCFIKLAQCDSCIISPEKCHYHLGTCREPEWGEEHCMTDHIVYLANSSGVKVGITRASQVPTRWIDQGATQALPIYRVKTRRQAGFIEDALRKHVADRTQWQAMLRGDPTPVDLPALRDALLEKSESDLNLLETNFGLHSLQCIEDGQVTEISYPVLEYPEKVRSFNLDKQPVVEGRLQGIKGQYLIFDTGVINIRKYTAYLVRLSVH